jgi:hypothetical protein
MCATRDTNKFLTDQAPWLIKGDGPDVTAQRIEVCCMLHIIVHYIFSIMRYNAMLTHSDVFILAACALVIHTCAKSHGHT